MAERVATALFRLWLRLLPADFRDRAGDELVQVFRSRLRSAHGVPAVLRALLLEFSGVVTAAVRSRFPPPTWPTPTPTSRPSLEPLLHDIRYAARGAVRRPGPTVLVVLTLGLGVAASTAMFSVVDSVLLRAPPFPEPEAVVSVYARNPDLAGHPTLGDGAERGWFSYPEFRALREHGGDVLAGLAPLSPGGVIVQGDAEPERILVGRTNADLFGRVLRVRPLVGRLFSDDDAPVDRRIVITESFWRRWFGADPAVVGTVIHFDMETPYTIVGVLPATAQLPGYPVEGWTLMGTDENWGNHWLLTIGRLAPGVTEDRAAARLSSILAVSAPAGEVHGINVFPRHADETRGVRGTLWLLALASLLLLAVACVNVAAVLVSRGIEREQELAVRVALGAERSRLVRQLLTESLLLAGLAAAVGVLLAGSSTRVLVLLAPEGVPRIAEATVDLRALAFGVGVAIACGPIFGLLPALQMSRRGLRASMMSSSRGAIGGRARVQAWLVVAELALATILLVGAGLLGRTLLALNSVDLGFAASETLALRVTVPSSRLFRNVDMRDDSARVAAVDAFYRSLIDPIAAIPGVRGIAITSNLPLSGDRANNPVRPEGHDGDGPIAERRFVSADYFDVMGMRIVEGRAFSRDEDRRGGSGTVVVSESLARIAWPGESAIGKRLEYYGGEVTVVGVAADVHDQEVAAGTALAFYVPRMQAGNPGGSLVIRTSGDATSLVPAIRRSIHAVDGQIAINMLRPLSDFVVDQTASQRYRARLILVFSGLATLFSLMGVYGITARSVAARTKELGIRTALGARKDGLMALVLGQALRLAALGAAAGIMLSFVATRSLEAYLWGVARTDPLTLIGAGALLAAASLLSALAPALRAARVDPIDALRSE